MILIDFRRKSDFHPKTDINDGSSGKTEKYFGPMTHRRRKSEGYIDHDYNKVSEIMIIAKSSGNRYFSFQFMPPNSITCLNFY